jgi:hypothetical protein
VEGLVSSLSPSAGSAAPPRSGHLGLLLQSGIARCIKSVVLELAGGAIDLLPLLFRSCTFWEIVSVVTLAAAS